MKPSGAHKPFFPPVMTVIVCSHICLCSLFDLILYVPVNNFSVMWDGSSWVEPVLGKDKCVLLKVTTVTMGRPEPTAPWSQFKHPTTEPLCLYSSVSYIANNVDPDQTAPMGAVWSGSIVFATMIKSSLKSTWIYASDVKSRHFQDKTILAGWGSTCTRSTLNPFSEC